MSEIIGTQSNGLPSQILTNQEITPIKTNPETPQTHPIIPESPIILIEKDPSLKINPIQNPALLTTKNIYEEEKKKIPLLSHFQSGKIPNAIFNVAVLALGTGCFSIGKKVEYMSICFTPIYIVVAGIVNWWSIYLMGISADKHKIFDYGHLVLKLYGKGLSFILDFSIILYDYGVIILYQIVAYKLIGGVINDLGKYGFQSLDDFVDNSFWKKKVYKFPIFFGINILILIPLCLLKNIAKMGFTVALGIISFFVLAFIVIFESPFFIQHYFNKEYIKSDSKTHMNIYDITKGFDQNLNFLRPFATLFFAYSCQSGIFPVFANVKNFTINKVKIISKYAIGICIIIYLLLAILGYMTQPINPPSLIIERKSIFKNDIIMNIGRMDFIITILTKIPPIYNSMRITLVSMIGKDPNNFTNLLNCSLTIPLLLFSCLVGALYQHVTDYIDLIGSVTSIFIMFLIPGLIYIKSNDYSITHWKNVTTIILISLFSLICLISAIFTVKDIIKKA